jgi:dihydrofolate reductase
VSQHIEITRIFDAPRELVYQAFTDPGQLAQWFGPVGSSARTRAAAGKAHSPSWTRCCERVWGRNRDPEVVMARLIYSAMASADGFTEDPSGGLDWGIPDEELLRFINDRERPAGTYLYGRRMYEAMLYWETASRDPGQPPLLREFTGIWQAATKIVFSTTLTSVSSARTRIEPDFDPAMVRQLKSATGHEMRVAGADLAGQAMKAGLVDELRLFLAPVVLGGGKPALPRSTRAPDRPRFQILMSLSR